MKTGTSLSVVFLFVPKYTDNECIRQTLANPPQKFSITFSNQGNSEKGTKAFYVVLKEKEKEAIDMCTKFVQRVQYNQR